MRSPTGFLDRAGEAVGENHIMSRRFAVRERLEHHVVSGLRQGCTVPRSMKCNENTAAIGSGELRPGVERHVVGRPMGRECSERGALFRAWPNCLSAVTAILGSQHELLLGEVEITFRP